MLKSFINAKTGEKVKMSPKDSLTQEAIEEKLWVKIKWKIFSEEKKSTLESKKKK